MTIDTIDMMEKTTIHSKIYLFIFIKKLIFLYINNKKYIKIYIIL